MTPIRLFVALFLKLEKNNNINIKIVLSMTFITRADHSFSTLWHQRVGTTWKNPVRYRFSAYLQMRHWFSCSVSPRFVCGSFYLHFAFQHFSFFIITDCTGRFTTQSLAENCSSRKKMKQHAVKWDVFFYREMALSLMSGEIPRFKLSMASP